jgi:hypothetical protein
VREVFEHFLARQTPRKLTVPAVYVRSAAISYVQHEVLRALIGKMRGEEPLVTEK